MMLGHQQFPPSQLILLWSNSHDSALSSQQVPFSKYQSRMFPASTKAVVHLCCEVLTYMLC